MVRVWISDSVSVTVEFSVMFRVRAGVRFRWGFVLGYG